jgi:hypothetical protein
MNERKPGLFPLIGALASPRRLLTFRGLDLVNDFSRPRLGGVNATQGRGRDELGRPGAAEFGRTFHVAMIVITR